MASHEKFVRFYHAHKTGMMNMYLEKILDREGDINNYVIPDNSSLCYKESYLIGSTVLHFVQNCRHESDILKILLKRGANFTIKNGKGSTVLHSSIENDFCRYRNIWSLRLLEDRPRESYVDLILEAHVSSENFANPCDSNGISHFHIACITNNYKSVEFFLRNGIPVAHAVNKDSKNFAGYSPLHLAVECCAFETAKVLLEYGASINDKNTSGLSSLHLLMMQKINIIHLINAEKLFENILPSDEINEKLMNLFLEGSGPNVIIDDSGLSQFHVICTMRDLSKVKYASNRVNDINGCVDQNSAAWPGYTALHFAAHCNVDMVKLLLDKGANIATKNKEGITPFDLCLEWFKIEDIHYILSGHPVWKDVIMSDAKTKLVDLVFAMRSAKTLVTFLGEDARVNLFIPINSTLWPGCAILHLAVIFLERTTRNLHIQAGNERPIELNLSVLEELLNGGGNVGYQNVQGQTPIHMAFHLGHVSAVNLMLKFHEGANNRVDQDNLSHLHIACAAQNKSVVEKLLSRKIDINSPVFTTFKWYNTDAYEMWDPVFFINVGSTALHICVANKSCKIAELLLIHGGNLCPKDGNGLTPIHRVLTLHGGSNAIGQLLLDSPSLVECIVENLKLSHLHVASFVGHISAVRRLLALGVDANTGIDTNYNLCNLEHHWYGDPSLEPLSFLAGYNGLTAVHFAIIEHNNEVAELLMQQSYYDVLLKNLDVSTALQSNVNLMVDFLYTTLRKGEHMRERFQKDTDLTLLHIACCKFDVDMVTRLLVKGADVNARVQSKSRLWPGNTPLHVLMIDSDQMYLGHSSVVIRRYNERQRKIDVILPLLLEHGADVTLSNAMHDTPLNMRKSPLNYIMGKNSSRLILMLRSQKDFKVNPVNKEGLSHFLIACRLKETAIINKFLKNRVDVNQPIGEFVDEVPSYTSLHLALSSETFDIKTTKTLLQNGADVKAVGEFINGTPSYTAAHLVKSNKTTNLDAINLLVEYGADVNARDAFDNTPLHFACHYQARDLRNLFQKLLNKFLKHGADTNIHNVYGMTPLLQSAELSMTLEDLDVFFRYGFKFNQFNTVTEESCIAKIFHQRFRRPPMDCGTIISGLNVAEVDEMRRTLIHNIVSLHPNRWNDKFDQLEKIIDGFIKKGINIDHQDKLGRTALHLAAKFQNRGALSALLDSGADINIVDANGQSAYENILQLHPDCRRMGLCGHEDNYHVFMHHVNDLLTCRLYVSVLNMQTHIGALERCHGLPIRHDELDAELDKAKITKIERDSLTLYDFMSETGAVAAYAHMMPLKRQTVKKFVESIDAKHFRRIRGLLKLQYRKALARPQLADIAKAPLVTLLKFPLPDVCSALLFRYLANADLKNIIAAAP